MRGRRPNRGDRLDPARRPGEDAPTPRTASRLFTTGLDAGGLARGVEVEEPPGALLVAPGTAVIE